MNNSRYIFSIVLMIAFLSTQAQESLNASGGESSGPGHASYSVGQVSYTALEETGGAHLIQGVQVPFEFFINTCAASIELTPELFGTPAWDTIPVPGAGYSTPGALGDASDDTWYYFTAESANDYILAQSANGSFDAVIEFFDQCAGNLLGSYNNYGDGATERVIPGGLTPGTEYHFRVYDPEPGLPGASDVRVQVKTFAKAGLRDQYCGVMDYSLDDVITPKRQDLNQLYPFTNVIAKGYGVRLIDQASQDTAARFQTGVPSWYFTMNTFANADIDRTYDATARHMLRLQANGALGNYWSDWGPDCTIGIGNVPLTQIRPQFCDNLIDYGFDQLIQAEYVPFADRYRFTFTDGTNVLVEENNSYGVFLYELEGLELNTSYAVTVQSRVNGVWSAPGPSCDIFMLNQSPSTELQSAYCNGTYLTDHPNYLLAEYIYGATQYEWRFTPLGGGDVMTEMTTGLSMAFHISDLEFIAGETYDVAVRAYAGGVWGDFGTTCSISMQAAPSMEPTDDELLVKSISSIRSELIVSPNPNEGLLINLTFIEVSGLDDVTLLLRDIHGRLVQTDQVSLSKEVDSYTWVFDRRLESGIYLIEMVTEKSRSSAVFVAE